MDRTACTEPQCLYKGALYLYLLVPWSRKSRAIPLLPLWTVRPVQSLSACTRVHFSFFYFTDINALKVKVSLYTVMLCRGVGGLKLWLYPFVTSALDWCGWSMQRSSRLTPSGSVAVPTVQGAGWTSGPVCAGIEKINCLRSPWIEPRSM